jgi:hypothetical protein
MANEIEKIEDIRVHFESRIMATPGVVAVGVGTSKDGRYILVIGTDRPEDEVRAKLPPEIFSVPVQLEYMGKIEAQ